MTDYNSIDNIICNKLKDDIKKSDIQFEDYTENDILRLSYICIKNDIECKNLAIRLLDRFVRWRKTKPYKYTTKISKYILLSSTDYDNILKYCKDKVLSREL